MYAIRSYYEIHLEPERAHGLARLATEGTRLGPQETRELLGDRRATPHDFALPNVITSYSIHYTKLYDVSDIGLTVHPHPTLSETVYFAAEIAEGSITDLYLPKRR